MALYARLLGSIPWYDGQYLSLCAVDVCLSVVWSSYTYKRASSFTLLMHQYVIKTTANDADNTEAPKTCGYCPIFRHSLKKVAIPSLEN
jgi:hypothetical protein